MQLFLFCKIIFFCFQNRRFFLWLTYGLNDCAKMIVAKMKMNVAPEFSRKLISVLMTILLVSACAKEPKRVGGELAFTPESMTTMAETFAKAGDYGNAIRLYRRAATENPENAAVRLELAKIYQKVGARDAAKLFYDQVLVLDPDNFEAKLGIGQLLLSANKAGEAIPYLKDLLPGAGDNHTVYNSLGLAYDLNGQHEQAQLSYGQGLNKVPDNISLLNNLALSLAIEEQYAAALRLLNKAVNLDYSKVTAQKNLIMVYALSGEEQAAEDIAKSFNLQDEFTENKTRYNWLGTLSSARRAQAIFLGINSFPKEEVKIVEPEVVEPQPEAETTASEETVDPKRQQLLDILAQEGNNQETVATVEAEPEPAQQQPKTVPVEVPAKETNDRATEKASEKMPLISEKKPTETVYLVQLGSYPNQQLAERAWTKISKKSEGLLMEQTPFIKEVELENAGTLFRLFVGSVTERSPSRELCSALKEYAIDCLVLKTSLE